MLIKHLNPWDQRWADAGQPPVHLPLQPVACLPASTRHKTPKPFSVSASHAQALVPGQLLARRHEMTTSEEKSQTTVSWTDSQILCKCLGRIFHIFTFQRMGLVFPEERWVVPYPWGRCSHLLRAGYKTGSTTQRHTKTSDAVETECLENSCLANRCPKHQQRYYSYKRQQGSQQA